MEDRLGFREKFRIGVGDFKFVLNEVSQVISPVMF